jgi:hypothetical protein
MAPIRLKGNAWNKTELVTLTPVGTVLAVTRKLKQKTAITKASILRTRTKGTPGMGVWFKMQGKAEQHSRGLVRPATGRTTTLESHPVKPPREAGLLKQKQECSPHFDPSPEPNC